MNSDRLFTLSSLCDILQSKSVNKIYETKGHKKGYQLPYSLYLYKSIIYPKNSAEIMLPHVLTRSTSQNLHIVQHLSTLDCTEDLSYSAWFQEICKLIVLFIKTKFAAIEERSNNLLSNLQIQEISDLVDDKLFNFIDGSLVDELKKSSDSKIMTALLLRCFYIDESFGNPLSLIDKIKFSFLLEKNSIKVTEFLKYFPNYIFTNIIAEDYIKEIEKVMTEERYNKIPYRDILPKFEKFIDFDFNISPKKDLADLISIYIHYNSDKRPQQTPTKTDIKSSISSESALAVPKLSIFTKISNLLVSIDYLLELHNVDLAMENYEKARMLYETLCELDKERFYQDFREKSLHIYHYNENHLSRKR